MLSIARGCTLRRCCSASSGWTPQYSSTSSGPTRCGVGAAVIFIECGLLFPFLPGDSLLFTVGLLCRAGQIHGAAVVRAALVLTVAADVGNAVGYLIGAKAGPAIFQQENSRIFKQKYVDKTAEFFDKYGNRAIVLGAVRADRPDLHHRVAGVGAWASGGS